MWINDPWELLSLDILPEANDSASNLINKFTRMFLIVLFLMWYYSYTKKQILQVVVGASLLILCLFSFTNKKENFSHVHVKMDQTIPQIPISALSKPVVPIIQSFEDVTRKQKEPFVSQIQNEPRITSIDLLNRIVNEPIQNRVVNEPRITSIDMLNEKPMVSMTMLQNLYRTSHHPTVHKPKSEFPYHPTPTHQPSDGQDYYTPQLGNNKRMQHEAIPLAPRIMDPQFSNVETQSPVDNNPLVNLGGMSMPIYKSNERKYNKPSYPVINETEFDQRRMFLQDVQPHQYSFTNDRTPINASIGISSTPQIPPLERQTIRASNGQDYPLFSRIDPELVRDDVSDERKKEMPKRTSWSEKLPETNPLNDSTVYDPRFSGYGDSARAYYDSDFGQIRYYYTDVDSYRSPNFIVRNKIDHVEFIDPMGHKENEYRRTEALDDVTEQVNTDWMSKSTEFREDMMERLMRKNNAMNWQMRFAPHSKGSRLSTFTSSY